MELVVLFGAVAKSKLCDAPPTTCFFDEYGTLWLKTTEVSVINQCTCVVLSTKNGNSVKKGDKGIFNPVYLITPLQCTLTVNKGEQENGISS